MSGKGQGASSDELTRLLHELGQQAPTERSAQSERKRAERIAARLDAELKSLVAQRRRRLRLWVPLAAAAALPLGVGLWYERGQRPAAIAIEQEPISGRRIREVLPPDARPVPVRTSTPAAQSANKELRPASSAARPEAAGDATPKPSEPAESASTLGAQNELFRVAVEATRSGDTTAALEHLDRLLDQYPESPLAQTALVRKFRLLSEAGRREAAVAEARRYLQLYPTGFALSEANRILHGEPSEARPSAPGAP